MLGVWRRLVRSGKCVSTMERQPTAVDEEECVVAPSTPPTRGASRRREPRHEPTLLALPLDLLYAVLVGDQPCSKDLCAIAGVCRSLRAVAEVRARPRRTGPANPLTRGAGSSCM